MSEAEKGGLKLDLTINIPTLIAIVTMIGFLFKAYYNIEWLMDSVEQLKNQKLDVIVYHFSEKEMNDLKSRIAEQEKTIIAMNIEIARLKRR